MVRRVTEQRWSLAEAAEAAGVSERTACKWTQRYRSEGEVGLWDRSSAPRSVPNRTPEDRVAAIAALRRVRMTGPEIAEVLEMAFHGLRGAVADRPGHARPPAAPGASQPIRASQPGELIHIDVKKLVRIEKASPGDRHHPQPRRRLERVHVCVDDATRLAYVEVLSDEKGSRRRLPEARPRLLLSPRHHRRAVMTDNGPAYLSIAHAIACRPWSATSAPSHRPRTNGKAERYPHDARLAYAIYRTPPPPRYPSSLYSNPSLSSQPPPSTHPTPEAWSSRAPWPVVVAAKIAAGSGRSDRIQRRDVC